MQSLLTTPENMSMLYIIVSVSFTTFSLALKMCPESIPTVSIVNRCPSSATEWVSAAKRKSCYDLGQLQSCAKADDFVYHCVLNKDATMLLEVCAPTYLMSGYCARFSEVEKRIIIDTGLDCTKFDPPCSTSFMSNESYKYQTCYRNAGENPKGCEASQEKNLHITTVIVISVIFAIIILLILIIIGVGCKLKMIKFTKKDSKQIETDSKVESKSIENETKTNTASSQQDLNEPNDNEAQERPLLYPSDTPAQDPNEPNDNKAQERPLLYPSDTPAQGAPLESNVQEDNQSCSEEKKMGYKSLSGEKEGTISLKDVKTISDVRDILARELDVVRGTLCVVDRNTGRLWNDDKDVNGLLAPLTLMIALDEDRMKLILHGDNANEGDDNDKYDGRLKRKDRNIKKNCTHFKDDDKWFRWTTVQLLKKKEANLHCPRCNASLDVEEIAKSCKMTTDEELFFKLVKNLNRFHENCADFIHNAVL